MNEGIEVLSGPIKKVDKNIKFVDKIKANDNYYIWKRGASSPAMTVKGKQIKDHFGVETWTEFLNCGYLPAGSLYDILIVGGSEDMRCVFQGASQSFGFPTGNGLNDDVNNSAQPALNKGRFEQRPGTLMEKAVFDGIHQNTSLSIEALKDALASSEDQIVQLQNQINMVRLDYEGEMKQFRQELQEKDKELAKMEGVIETLKRDMETERRFKEMEDKLRIEKEDFIAHQKDPLESMVGLAEKLAPLAGMFGKMHGAMPNPQIAKAPNMNNEIYNQQMMDNVKYTEAETNG